MIYVLFRWRVLLADYSRAHVNLRVVDLNMFVLATLLKRLVINCDFLFIN